jgi:hypothetical protein
LDAHALEGALAQELGEAGLVALVKKRCTHLFSAQPFFVSSACLQRMERVVRAIESATSLSLHPAAVYRPSRLLMRAIPQRHPADEAHSSPSRAITADVGGMRLYSHCEIE